MPQFILANSVRVVDLVAENEEGHFGEVLEAEEFVESVFGFGEAVDVFSVYEVYYSGDFGEILQGRRYGLVAAWVMCGVSGAAAGRGKNSHHAISSWLVNGRRDRKL